MGAFSEWDGPDEDVSKRIVEEALRLGCTFFDTASPYADGRSEEYLGRALEDRRDRAVICTNFGFWAPGYQDDHSADRIEEAVELSLRRLRTDYLDVLLFHGPPDEWGGTPRHWEILRDLVDSGVLRSYGVSIGSGGCQQLRYALEHTGSQVIQLHFNPVRQELMEAFDEAAEAGVGLIANVPLQAGWLTGKYTATSEFTGSRDERWDAEYKEAMAGLVREFGSLLPDDVQMSHGALAYILAQPEISTVIPGAKSVEQLRNNLAATDVRLPPGTVEAIRQFGSKVPPTLI